MSLDPSGPDVPEIQCWVPDGCCGPSVCGIQQEDFICQIRSLAPEGDIYNNTQPAILPTVDNRGAVTVGCSLVGCQQLILGSCCDNPDIPCVSTDPVAPQLAVIDSFAAVAYTAVNSLCQLLHELDPCTAQTTLHCWAQRFGITYPDPCDTTGWSDSTLAFLVCLIEQLRYQVYNWDTLQLLAARFGASLVLHYAGDFNCGPAGWWTMARDGQQCPPRTACPPDPDVTAGATSELMRFVGACWNPPPSLNIVISPANIEIPGNCNLPGGGAPIVLPHDDELYLAFKWLLGTILPRNALWCVYEQDPANCIV